MRGELGEEFIVEYPLEVAAPHIFQSSDRQPVWSSERNFQQNLTPGSSGLIPDWGNTAFMLGSAGHFGTVEGIGGRRFGRGRLGGAPDPASLPTPEASASQGRQAASMRRYYAELRGQGVDHSTAMSMVRARTPVAGGIHPVSYQRGPIVGGRRDTPWPGHSFDTRIVPTATPNPHGYSLTPSGLLTPTATLTPAPTGDPTPTADPTPDPTPTPGRPDPTPTPTPGKPDPTPTPGRPDPTPTPTPGRPDPTPTPGKPDPTATPTPGRPDPTPTPTTGKPDPTPTPPVNTPDPVATPPEQGTPTPTDPTVGTPDPNTPDPNTPEPTTPDPNVPEPNVPEPEVPQPDIPEPDIPEPDVPEPEIPEPETPTPTPPPPTGGRDEPTPPPRKPDPTPTPTPTRGDGSDDVRRSEIANPVADDPNVHPREIEFVEPVRHTVDLITGEHTIEPLDDQQVRSARIKSYGRQNPAGQVHLAGSVQLEVDQDHITLESTDRRKDAGDPVDYTKIDFVDRSQGQPGEVDYSKLQMPGAGQERDYRDINPVQQEPSGTGVDYSKLEMPGTNGQIDYRDINPVERQPSGTGVDYSKLEMPAEPVAGFASSAQAQDARRADATPQPLRRPETRAELEKFHAKYRRALKREPTGDLDRDMATYREALEAASAAKGSKSGSQDVDYSKINYRPGQEPASSKNRRSANSIDAGTVGGGGAMRRRGGGKRRKDEKEDEQKYQRPVVQVVLND